jgi:hypothetical protein
MLNVKIAKEDFFLTAEMSLKPVWHLKFGLDLTLGF